MRESFDAVIIGGGFYGLYLAEHLAGKGKQLVLCDREPELMRRASYSNQARVHNGYHYPRSILTALRSRVNFPRFVDEFRPAIESNFEKIYAVGLRHSKVTAQQFYRSMRTIGAPIEPAPKSIRNLFDSGYIEEAFLTREYAFNATTLRNLMAGRVERAGIEVRLQTNVRAVRPDPVDGLQVEIEGPGGPATLNAGHVFCCGYSQLNAPAAAAGLPPLPLKHELVEMALVEVPDRLRELGVTVMDGPFFSLMPFPARRLHTLSHVRYTPHSHWFDGDGEYQPPYEVFERAEKQTAFPHMIRDASRFLPMAARCSYRGSLWEIKTLLPRSETDDSRPILLRTHFGMRNFHLVMGGKIDNIYDIVDVVDSIF